MIRCTILIAFFFLPAAAEAESRDSAKGAAAGWQGQGPALISGGQVENIAGSPVAGAINVLATHPTNPDILYAGTVNGGIWRTTSATGVAPQWQALTDDLPSLSIGDLKFDRTDGSFQTLVASTARTSSFNSDGGALSGLLRTTDGGATWQHLPALSGRNLVAVFARGARMVAASNLGETGACDDFGVYLSSDTGATWQQADNGLPLGVVDAMAADPVNPDVLYASVLLAANCTPGAVNGIYKSLDFGASWFKSSPAPPFPLDGFLEDSFATHVEMSVGTANNLFVAISPASSNRLGGVFHTPDGGALWFQMDLPGTFEPEGFEGIHPGRQGFIHMSLAADPFNANLVYIGGDRQPQPLAGFPNNTGATNFTGRLFRGDTFQPIGSQWAPLTHFGTSAGSAPHADSRHLSFDAMGGLLDANDGGVYARSLPQGFFGDWFSLNGNLQITEIHDAALDANAGIILGGNQDNGSTEQSAAGSQTWVSVNQGDGGDVAVAVNNGQSVRYHSAADFNAFSRSTFDAANNLLDRTFPALVVVDGGAELAGQFKTPVVTHHGQAGRLIIGGGNSVYESVDGGDSVTELLPGVVVDGFAGSNIIHGTAANAEFLALAGCSGGCASGASALYVRESAGATPQSVFTSAATGGIRALAATAEDSSRLWLLEAAGVTELASGGSVRADRTGNLFELQPGRLRNLLAVTTAEDTVLLVAADRGVFAAFTRSGLDAWFELAPGLPEALVFELDYDPDSDRLLAATLGRGAFRLETLSRFAPQIFSDGFER